ncbi:hypothetical protein ACLOJK_002738 [Asimina triloba]
MAITLEKVNLRSLRGIAKIIGTVACVLGAISIALIKGTRLLNMKALTLDSIMRSTGANLYLGSLIGAVVVVAGLYAVLWGKAQELETKAEVRPNHETSLIEGFSDESSKDLKIEIKEPLLGPNLYNVEQNETTPDNLSPPLPAGDSLSSRAPPSIDLIWQ